MSVAVEVGEEKRIGTHWTIALQMCWTLSMLDLTLLVFLSTSRRSDASLREKRERERLNKVSTRKR